MKFKRLSIALGAMLAIPLLPQVASAQTSSSTPIPAVIAASAPTAVPALVPFAGMVAIDRKQSLSDSVSITFQIFKQESGGNALWIESQTVALDAGRYKVQLGAASPSGIPLELFQSGEARWLEVQVAGQAPQPRVLLASVPYALKAADSETLAGHAATDFVTQEELAGRTPAPNAEPGAPSNAASPTSPTGTGTVKYLPMWTGNTTLADSILYQAVSGTSPRVGVNTTTPGSTFDINGTSTVRGTLNLPSAIATAAAAANSPLLELSASAYSSGAQAAVQQKFGWEVAAAGNNTATPTANLNLFYGAGTATPKSTGLAISPVGLITFVPGQTFPGTSGVIAAGTGLRSSTAGTTQTLSVDTSLVPLLAVNNIFTGTQTMNSLNVIQTVTAANVNATTVYDLGGLPFAFGANSQNSAYLGFAGNQNGVPGVANTGVGVKALSQITTGYGNTAIGSYTMENDATGIDNVAVGDIALSNNSTGSQNTAVGHNALGDNFNGSGNTAVGYNAGPYEESPNLTNSTAIGNQANVSQSNSLVLGQTYKGYPGAGHVNVGIGTSAPATTLEVAVKAAGALGPTLTLTNPGGDGASASVDFKTYLHPSTANAPTARILAVDDNNYGTSLYFQSKTPGSDSNGLQSNMLIASNGRVSIPGQMASSQFYVAAPAGSSYPGIQAIGGSQTSGTSEDIGDGGDFIGGDNFVESASDQNAAGSGVTGSGGTGKGSTNFGGEGGQFTGGPGAAGGGDGLFATPGSGTNGQTGYAADLDGDVYVKGAVITVSADFQIDHPLDPANKYLNHTSVESSEGMNIYTGNVVTDELGLAVVKLPEWFQAVNSDFRYQLTVMGRFAQAIVSKEIENNQFTISTNATHVKVSWLVTAVRQDPYAKAHPLAVEQEKPSRERGYYLHPELYGQPEEKQTEWGRRPATMKRIKARAVQAQAQGSPAPVERAAATGH